jgi:RHS repeat-associated protein
LNQTFQTDNADQLVNVSRNNNLLTVAGSLSNAVTSLTVNGQPATLYHDLTWAVPGGITLTSGQNQLTAVVTAGGLTRTNSLLQTLPATVALRYDGDGNLTWDGLLAYTYDCADELTAVTLTNAWKTAYAYDGLGRRRIRKDYTWTHNLWAETNEVHYVYAGMNVLQERNANNVPLVTYTRGIGLSSHSAATADGLLARTDANGPAYYHDDANGNVTALVNGSGTVVAKYLYDSFGNTLGMWGYLAAGNTYRFSSKEVDARTGLYYYGYRWYDPNLQRWLNQDPIQERGGINLYRFVGNNPIQRIDPLGLSWWQFWNWSVFNWNKPTLPMSEVDQINASGQNWIDPALSDENTFDNTFVGSFSLNNLVNGNLGAYAKSAAETVGVKGSIYCIGRQLAPKAAAVLGKGVAGIGTGLTVAATGRDLLNGAINGYINQAVANPEQQAGPSGSSPGYTYVGDGIVVENLTAQDFGGQ